MKSHSSPTSNKNGSFRGDQRCILLTCLCLCLSLSLSLCLSLSLSLSLSLCELSSLVGSPSTSLWVPPNP
jgi:hypothetical protein